MFVTMMILGLVGLLLMALPGLGRHGHAAPGAHGIAQGGGAHGSLHAGTHAAGTGGAAHGHAAPVQIGKSAGQAASGDPTAWSAVRLIPSPHTLFTLLALVGAFGQALEKLAHLPAWAAVVAALVPSLLIELYAVKPLWDLLFRFQGVPSRSLHVLLLTEAEAVTAFRNGKGIVRVVHDGRLVQLSARLCEKQAALPVQVGDRVCIEEIDPRTERAVVSLHR